MSEATARMLGEKASGAAPPIMGVGLSMEAWARSCASEESVAVSACGPIWALQCEFPAVPWALMALPLDDSLVIVERSWRAPAADLHQWDRVMGALCQQPRWLVVQGDDESITLGDTAREILTRYQRLAPRTNAASEVPVFRKVLSGHRALHDLSLPRPRAEYEHALDTWQWVLRLAPFAGLAVQLAALFHDVQHLMHTTEPPRESPAPDAAEGDDAPVEDGAPLAAQVLDGCAVDRATGGAAVRLIQAHHAPWRPALGGEVALLADADALSFLSLGSPAFADAHGAERTQKKVRRTLARMSSRAVRQLAGVRLRDDIRRHLTEAAQAEMHATLQQLVA